ncbi:MAG: GNAT family N-acetyltransferase [Rhodocyclales bacterium GT-UBC]|nr:MAG: GNAT family N-acetyltransferase [Rhodocyclales bacterium GT-UBC]
MNVFDKQQALRFLEERRTWFAAAGNPVNPFATFEWQHNFVEQIGESDWDFLFPTDVDGQSTMLLYRPPGGTVNALANYYASLYSPLIGVGADRAVSAEQLVDSLGRARPGIATVNLSPLDAASPDLASLKRAFAAQAWYVREYYCFGNWYLPCEGLQFDAYMQSRDSRLRNTWTRKAKKFYADSANRLEIITAPADVDRGMDAYEQVYRKSWKNAEPYPGFIRQWVRICAERGWLRLGLACVGDVPVAAQLWFTLNRRAYIFKLAYDEDYAQISAGTILTAEMFKMALDVDAVVEIDYLTGDDAYKKSWMSHRRERVGIIACNLRSVAGLVRAGRERLGAVKAAWQARRALPASSVTEA